MGKDIKSQAIVFLKELLPLTYKKLLQIDNNLKWKVNKWFIKTTYRIAN